MKRKGMTYFSVIFLLVSFFSACEQTKTVAPVGERLYADVEKYVSFGDHRTGTPVNTQTTAWLGEELNKYGYTVGYPEFPVRQYFFDKAAIVSGNDSIAAFPQWWVNEQVRQSVQGRLADITSLSVQADPGGKIIVIHVPEGEVLPAFRLIDTLAENGAMAVVVMTENPLGDMVVFNSTAKPDPWKIPVVLVAAKDSAKLAAFAARQQIVRLYVDGEYKDVKGKNVYGAIGKGGKYVVISTPISGWFGCGGERGPGIAVWLELARWAATLKTDYTFFFTGNSGHEIGGIGAHLFLDELAPPIENTHLWIHLGAGLATLACQKTPEGLVKQNEVDSLRNFFYSEPVKDSFTEVFEKTKAQKFSTDERNAGELVYVAQKGYKRILGVSYIHPYFHTPADSASTTSSRILEDITADFQRFILKEVAVK
jgi:hypothetical protein